MKLNNAGITNSESQTNESLSKKNKDNHLPTQNLLLSIRDSIHVVYREKS